MKLYAPEYYQNFHCIADQCRHSCCIGWEIDVDEEALAKYQALKGGYGSVIQESISSDPDGEPHFRLGEGERCPHLNEQGLCRIILNLGEDHLCGICREHPRFYNFTQVAEVGVGMSCEEAARLILSSPRYFVMKEIGEVSAVEDGIDFDGRAERERIYAILRDENANYPSRLAKIRAEYGISERADADWREKIDGLEYLDPAHKELFLNYSQSLRPNGLDEYLERALAYFVYRHCTEAFDAEDFSARLGFCLFCEGLLASMICARGAKELNEVAELARILSEEIEYSDENTLSLME